MSEQGGARRKHPDLFLLLPSWHILDHFLLPLKLADGVSLIAMYQHIYAVTVKRKLKYFFYLMPLRERKNKRQIERSLS